MVADRAVIRMTMRDALSDVGFQVVDAADAGEAIALLEHSETWCCVVSDIVMPGEMDGLSLAWEIRRRWAKHCCHSFDRERRAELHHDSGPDHGPPKAVRAR